MMKRFSFTLSIVLLVTVPVSLFTMPQRAQAIPVTVVFDPYTILNTIENAVTAIATPLSAVAEIAQQINDYILMPIAFIKSGLLMKSLTAGVIGFVTGQANGTGVPQFIQNLPLHLQRVGDAQAMSFFAQFARNSNSPFASAITSSLRTNYLLNTSAAGFWSANRSTLNRYSPNVNAFLAGNWSQGGIAAWYALTTQPQNNPYLFYLNSQSHLASRVGSAQAARVSTLNWGQGFLSWCGPVPTGLDTESGDYAPSDPCTQADGTPGIIKTPGATINATLNKVLGGTQDKLVQTGQIAAQMGGILNSIASIMGTINLAQDIFKGPTNGGLAGSYNYERTAFQTPNTTSNSAANAAQSGINSQSATLNANSNTARNARDTVTAGQQTQQSGVYTTAWNTIKNAATGAGTSVTNLKNLCIAAANATKDTNPTFSTAASAQAGAAETANTTKIQPVLSEANTALAITAPSSSQTSYAVEQSTESGEATANPTGSLTVSGGTIVDRMNLLSGNAASLVSVCTVPNPDSGG
jgi:hypothetical protein